MRGSAGCRYALRTLRGVFLLIVGSTLASAQTPSRAMLAREFEQPPKQYDLFPIWTWNGAVDVAEGKRQIDLMLQQGMRRAIVYPFTNLRTRPFSEEWWRVWGEFLSYAREKGFQLGIEPEIEWPDGVARDKWLPPPDQSLVLEGHPEYRMKRLVYVQREFAGPGKARFSTLPKPIFALAAKLTGPNQIDGDGILDLTSGLSGSEFSADLPPGNWKFMFYSLVDTDGPIQHLRIDPLNPDAVGRFIDVTLGEYYRRFKEYFGTTIIFVLIDNEGEYGNHIAWTPGLFEKFKAIYGYDLRTSLPLLTYEGGGRTAKVRNDYLNLVSDLYAKNYWGQMTQWSEAHKLELTAQSWTESMQFDAAYGGDTMSIMRSVTMPATEALGNRGRSPREDKELESLAHFEGRRYVCENQLVQGATSYISPQKMRYGTNTLATWGINLWTPMFYSDPSALIFPPEWFISQPWYKYFHIYTDYVRRISYMNDGGRHVADILLYRPIETVFADSNPIFQVDQEHPIASERWLASPESTLAAPSATSMISDSGREDGNFKNAYYPRMAWRSNSAAEVETAYTDLMEMLVGRQRDFDVADHYYLSRAKLERGALLLGPEDFHTIVLPPMKMISRSAIAKIRQFYEDGGNVIALRTLPSGSPEGGWSDPAVKADIMAIFGISPNVDRDAENQNAKGGRAIFVSGDIEKVVTALDKVSPADFRVEQGQRDRILYSHRTRYGADVYWVVNDSEQPRNFVVSVTAKGQPEIWDPETGKARATAYWVRDGRTYVPLEFNAWDASYLVLTKTDSTPRSIAISATNLSRYTIKVQPGGDAVVNGALAGNATQGFVEGNVEGKEFRITSANAKPAQIQVLPDDGWAFRLDSDQVPMRYARATRVAPSEGESAGFTRNDYNDQLWRLVPLSGEQFSIRNWWVLGPFPNPDKTGFNIAYPPEQKFDADAQYEGALGERITWRKYHSDSNQVDLRRAFGADDVGIGYATTWVYSPKDEHARAVLLGKNAKLWVNKKLAFGLFTNSWYYEFREPFSYDPEVELKAGWNEILVKVAAGDSGPNLVFSLHFKSMDGEPLTNLTADWRPEKNHVEDLPETDGQQQGADLWYRVEMPAGAKSLDLDHPERVAAVYADTRPLEVTKHVAIPQSPDQPGPRVLAIKMAAGEVLTKPLQFETSETKVRLGSWTRTGLTYFAGSATYKRDFQLKPELAGKQIFVDLGQVGVVAEIWMNGQHVTDRIWEPFRADITKFLKPGENTLQIVVTNSSDAANRALPDFAKYMEFVPLGGEFAYLDRTGPNGLIGPVTLIPFDQIQIAVKP